MSSLDRQFKPLEKVRTIPVHWEISNDDYEKLSAGNDESKNHWHCFMENSILHIYKGFGGNEHYRLTLHKQMNDTYVIEEVETHGSAESKEQYAVIDKNAVEEVASMLSHFFGVSVGRGRSGV
ncbi:MAG TPA: hypothetical protein VK497_03850 [Candidatus Saccharimonadales bacterium]|nr:hypothetical protein [Candidatus Saccharimonadales bacterium]